MAVVLRNQSVSNLLSVDVCSYCRVLTRISNRGLRKFKRVEDPDVIKAKPVFQYATETLKPRKRVYTWGLATSGALGNPGFVLPDNGRKPVEEWRKPHRMNYVNDMEVYDVAAGYGFTVFAGKSGLSDHKLFGTGINTDSQIGYHRNRDGKYIKLLVKPSPIPIPLQDGGRITKVSCGRAHTICLSNTNELFSMGNNAFGQCGKPIVENEMYIGRYNLHRIANFEEEIAEIVCGQDHTMLLTKSGSVHAFGWGADGQTGLGHYDNVHVPTKVKGDIEGEKIIHISSAADGVLACSEKGDLFGWGNSEYAQLESVTTEQQACIPRRLPFNNIGKVVQVAAGGTMCGIVNDKNQVFVWGFGLLGQGPKVDVLRHPSMIPETLFGRDSFNPETKLVSLVAGMSCFAAVSNVGELFMWGKNRSGALGFEKTQDMFFPMRVNVPAVVKKVALGIDHTVALCTTLI